MKRVTKDGVTIVVAPSTSKANPNSKEFGGTIISQDGKVLFGCIGTYAECILMCYQAHDRISREG